MACDRYEWMSVLFCGVCGCGVVVFLFPSIALHSHIALHIHVTYKGRKKKMKRAHTIAPSVARERFVFRPSRRSG